MSEPSPSGKRLLSIDGGAFRGLGCLLVIQAITNEAHRLCRAPGSAPLRPCEVFDLIVGSSTGGLVAVLVGRLGLDCTQAIQEYKTLAQKLFGTDRNTFLDVVTQQKPPIDPSAYEAELRALVNKYGGSPDLPFSPGGNPAASTPTGVLAMRNGTNIARLILSSEPDTYDWRVWEVARMTIASSIYASPLTIQNKGKPESYKDPASATINPTLQAIEWAKKSWKPESPGVIVSIGQGFSNIAVKGVKSSRADAKHAKPLIPSLLSNYPPPPSSDSALAAVQRVLEQAARTIEVDQQARRNSGYFRVDPSLNEEWELVDIFCKDIETNFQTWLASPNGKQVIEDIAKKLVKPRPVTPAEMTPPPPPPGTHKPHPACERPRPKEMDEYLYNYNVIFLIDDSTSMVVDPSSGSPNGRWDEMRSALQPIANFALQLRVNSIDMRFINSSLIHRGLKETKSIMGVFDSARPPDWRVRIQYTPTAASLRRVLDECINQLNSAVGKPDVYAQLKPFDIILLTDGLPDDDPKPVLESAWARLKAGKHHPNYVGVQIVQIGNDSQAKAKLGNIMTGNIGNIVDTVPYDGRPLTPERLRRILLGGVQPNVRALFA